MRKRRRNLFFARPGVLNWRHNRSQSPVFGLAVLYPTGSEIWCFWYIKTRERKIAMEKPFLLYLSVHWGDLIEQIKKICHIHFKYTRKKRCKDKNGGWNLGSIASRNLVPRAFLYSEGDSIAPAAVRERSPRSSPEERRSNQPRSRSLFFPGSGTSNTGKEVETGLERAA